MTNNKNTHAKMAKIRTIGLPVLLALAVSMGPSVASAETGSRVRANSLTTRTVSVLRPGELKNVRVLLQRGKIKMAAKLAGEFVDEARYAAFNSEIADTRLYRAAGLNALCVALTAIEKYGEAIDACEKAIKTYPRAWQAVNSLGVAYHAQGDYKKAAEYYRRALVMAPTEGSALEIVNHNIRLVEAK